MASIHSIADLNASKSLAIGHIANHLLDGQLTLFLGAGVSADAGLPGWSQLVEGMGKAAKVDPAKLRADRLKAVDDVVRLSNLEPEDLPHLVREALYSPYMRARGQFTKAVLRANVPLAVIELVSGSARGSISDIFTLNFDDLVEALLAQRGFVCQSVPAFPSLIDGTVDARVFHLHGFVPLVPTGASDAEDLVISYEQYRARLANEHPWHQLLEATLLSKTALFVGVSFDDLEMDSIFLRCFNALDQSRPVGFAIVRQPHDGVVRQLASAGIVCVAIDAYSEIPSVLQQVTRRAADLLSDRRGRAT